ncbi:MAG: hypothetical protein GPOALKHO_001354 [Sodalis sp.]|nr:MAG: hypothetical protein GPOALKHO_001354 [Sodalis sp.]
MAEMGYRAALFFTVLYSGIDRVSPAHHIPLLCRSGITGSAVKCRSPVLWLLAIPVRHAKSTRRCR